MDKMNKKEYSRKYNHKNNGMKILYASILLAFSAGSASAANQYEWNGSQDNNVNNPNNWTILVPDGSPFDETIINSKNPSFGIPQWVLNPGDPNHIQLPGGDKWGLTIGSEAGSDGELLMIRPDASFGNSSSAYLEKLLVGVDGGTGVLKLDMNQVGVTDPSDYRSEMLIVVPTSANDFALGVGAGSQGTINILGAGKSLQEHSNPFNNKGLAIHSSQGDDMEFKMGADGGTAHLNLEGGVASFEFGAGVMLGSGTGSTGEINVLGGGKFAQNVMGLSQLSEKDVFVLGDNEGHGVLNISGRSDAKNVYSRAVLGTGMVVGRGAGSTGKVYITNGAQIQSAVGGEYDSGTDSYTTLYNQHVVGADGGIGTVLIDGQDSIWKVLGGTTGIVSSSQATGVGELYVGQSGTGEVTISNGGTLSIGTSKYENYAETEHTGGLGTLYLGTESNGNGTLSIGGSLGVAAEKVGILDVADIQFGAGTGTVHFNHTDITGNYEFNTVLLSGAGSSNILHSNGVTLFSSDQSAFTGQTTITGGHLIVDNKLGGNVEVKTAGTLGGIGNVGNVVVNSGGTVAPGGYNEDRLNPPAVATLTVDSAIFNTGSTFSIQGSPSSSAHIDVLQAVTSNGGTGTVALNSGSKLYIQAGAGDWTLDTKYTFIKADGGVSGQFSTVGSNLAFLKTDVVYESNDVYLYFTRNAIGLGDIGATYNQMQAGAGIDSLGTGNVLYDTILGMSRDQANLAYNNLSGEIHANVKGALLNGMRHSRMAVNGHLGGLKMDDITPQKNLWVDAWGHNGSIKDDANASKIDTRGAGFLLGWDAYQNGDTTLGIAAGYERNSMDTDKIRDSKADVDALHLMVYGSTRAGSIDLRGGIGYALLDVSTERNVTVTGLEAKHEADYKGNMVQAFIEGSRTFKPSEQVSVTPYVGVAYQQVRTNSTTEKGNVATALHYHGGTDSLVSATAGGRVQLELNGNGKIYGDLGVRSTFGNKEPEARLNFAGGNTYNQKGASLNSVSAVVGLGAQFKTGDRSTVRIGYDGELGNKAKSHAAHVQWELRF